MVGIYQSWRYIVYVGLLGVGIGYHIGFGEIVREEVKYTTMKQITKNYQQKMRVQGVVNKKLFEKERTTVYRLLIDNFDTFDNFDTGKNTDKTASGGGNIPLSMFVEVPSNLHIEVGNVIRFEAKIENILSFPLSGYSRYAFFQGGFGYSYIPVFERISYDENTLLVDRVRTYWVEQFQQYFPRNIAGTLLGMTIGYIDILPLDVKRAFIDSGISHILVVSGSNIAFLIIIVTFFLKYLPLGRHLRVIIITLIVIFYGTLVGWDISVLRATIMGILSYTIVEYGSKGSSRASLGLALILLTLISPLSPLYDAGFALSFGATLGIIIFHEGIESYCKSRHIPHIMSSIISVSIGAMLGSLPIMIYHFEQIALSGLLTNLIIGGFIGMILFLCVGFIGIVGFSSMLAIGIGYIIYIMTVSILSIASFLQYGYILKIPHDIAPWISIFLCGWFFFVFMEQAYPRYRKDHSS